MLLDDDNKIWDEIEFDNEIILEEIVFKNYRLLYGDQSLLFKKQIIKTEDGKGTIPDGYIINLTTKEWYLVEVELLHHGVYDHIVPQITKQTNAATSLAVKAILRQSFLSQIQSNPEFLKIFKESEIPDIEISNVIEEILNKRPKVSIPIDNSSPDLVSWAQSLKYSVEIKPIKRYCNRLNGKFMLQFPDIEEPSLIEEGEGLDDFSSLKGKDLILCLIAVGSLQVGEILSMQHKKKEFKATVLKDGLLELIDKSRHSPSLAAIKCIQSITPERNTVNGLLEWKTKNGNTLRNLRSDIKEHRPTSY